MNLQKYLFRFTAFIFTFLLGWSIISGYRYLVSHLLTAHHISSSEEAGNTPAISDARKEVGIAREYCLFDEIQIFDDFDHLSIEIQNESGMPIPPRGAVYARHVYVLKSVSISPNFVRFETETVSGVHYDFIGELNCVDVMEGDENVHPIDGTFRKWENGKVTETKAVHFLPVVPNEANELIHKKRRR